VYSFAQLVSNGYLDARREPGRTTERTVYRLTEKGLDALRGYARTPARFTPLKRGTPKPRWRPKTPSDRGMDPASTPGVSFEG
jgi:DNA-binding PadR family transcriptional regulator